MLSKVTTEMNICHIQIYHKSVKSYFLTKISGIYGGVTLKIKYQKRNKIELGKDLICVFGD